LPVLALRGNAGNKVRPALVAVPFMNSKILSRALAMPDSENLKFARIWQSMGWMMVAIVVWLSLIPHISWEPPVIGWDKAQHFLAYGGLMYWFAMAFRRRWRWPVFLVALGAFLEFLQGLGGSRVPDVHDILANTLGVGMGWALSRSQVGSLLFRVDAALSR
jgi:glycopeptide antibiotics resistance protein